MITRNMHRYAIFLMFIFLVACNRPAPLQVDEQAPPPDSTDRFVELIVAEEAHSEPEESVAEIIESAEVVTDDEVIPLRKARVTNLMGAVSAGAADGDSMHALGNEGSSAGEARGIGGLGLSGAGRGGGGEGFGRVGGLGRAEGRVTGGMGMRGLGSSGAGRVGPHGRFQEPRQYNEGYKNYGINAWVRASEDRLSTFGADVDTGSYTLARRKLQSGEMPVAKGVRVEEFLNYYRYDYPEPDEGPIGVHLEAAPNPFSADPNRIMLRVGLQAKSLRAEERKPVHLTFLVDTSGSMRRPDRLDLAKRTLEILTNNLRPGDTVALATYAGAVEKILDPTGVEYKGRILEAIQSLRAAGHTRMGSGIDLAYELASKNFKDGHVNRVIVLSDGDANVGRTSHEEILKQIVGYVEQGITLSTVGFGVGNYQDVMMEQLANNGNGNYSYVDRIEEAHRIFGDQLGGTLEVIAKDVKIQVEFNPEAVSSYRLIGYENRDIADKDFRNDAVHGGEMGVGHTVTALYEVELNDGADLDDVATVRIRNKEPHGNKAVESSFSLRPAQIYSTLSEASGDFAFVVAVAAFAELLRESPHMAGVSLERIEALAERTASDYEDRKEFVDLVRMARPMLLARADAVR
ncbi:MAG: vWA domain-containing protein [Bradymonadaceae bacterium]